MLLGVLDIGSNSAQLQVFEARSGAPPLPTHAVKAPTLLGEAFGPDGAIEPAGVDRVVKAVNHAMNAARRLGVQQFYVFTTSAVRDAANRDLILDRVDAHPPASPDRAVNPVRSAPTRRTTCLLTWDAGSRCRMVALTWVPLCLRKGTR